jgi:hypothetical protein
MKISFQIALFFAVSFGALAQEDEQKKPNLFIRTDFEYGYVLQTDDFLRGNNLSEGAITDVLGGRIEAGWQSRGGNIYDGMLNYPTFGVGFLTYGFPQTGQLGEPNALYLFLNKPYKRWGNKYSFNYFIRLGMSYNWEPNDPAINPANLVLGSFRNLYISAGIEAEYNFTPRLSTSIGGAFAHFSNGQSSLPNAGMNLLTPHISIKYNFNDGEQMEYKKVEEPEFKDKGMEYYFTIGNGIRQIFFDTAATGVPKKLGVSYPVHNISVAAQYQFNWKGKFGGGLDFIYWGAQNPGIELGAGGVIQAKPVPTNEKLQLGVFVSYEFVLNNFSIYAQPGYRVIRTEYAGMPPDFYQHLAGKYHIRNLILGVAIRAVNFGIAEYIEWNVGYRFGKNTKN